MKKRLVLLLSVTMAFSMFSSVALGAPATNGKVKSVSKGKAAAPRANVNRNKAASKASTPAKADTLSPEKVKEIETLYMPYFNKLKDLGLVNGRGDGQAELASLLSRREAAKLVADLYAKNDQAFGTKLTEKKSSANKVAYNDPNYSQCGEAAEIEALTDKGIVRGKDTTKKIFGINDDVTVQEAAHMLANVWASIDGNKLPENASNSASEYAKSSYQLALNSDWVSKDANPQAKALRGQFMQMAAKAWDMLGPQVKSYKVVDPKTVEFTMSDGGTHTEKLEKALEANKETEITFTYKNKEGKEFKRTHKVKYEVTAAQSIKSVTADNFKLIRIEFDGKVDSKTAENVNNYKIPDYEFESATLSADGNAVDLLIKEDSKKLPKQKEVTLEFRGVKSTDNTRTFNQKMKFTPVDSKLPEVKEVKGLGTKAVKVVFSEPVTKETAGSISKYRIDGKTISGSVKFTYPNVAVIKTDMAVGEYTMTVEGVEDFAEFKSLKKEEKFTVALDSEAPKVVSAKAKDLRKVEIEFDESVESVAKAYHTSSSRTAKIEIKDTKVLLTFDEGNALTSLSETMIYLESVKDYSGNSANRDAKLTPELDSTRPSIVGIESRAKNDRTQLIIEFSQELLRTDVTNAKNYILRDKDGKIVTNHGFNSDGHPERQPDFLLDNNGKENKYKVVVEAYDLLPEAKYTLEVSGLRNLASPPNTMVPESKSVDVTNIAGFRVVNAWFQEDGDYWKVRVFFNKDVATSGTGSALSLAKYSYQAANGEGYRLFISDTEPSLYDNKTVEFKVAKKNTPYLKGSEYLRVNSIADSRGELTNDKDKSISQQDYRWGDGNVATVKGLRIADSKRAVIVYEGTIKNDDVRMGDFTFTVDGSIVTPRDTSTNSVSYGSTEITFTFDESRVNLNASNVTVRTRAQEDILSKDQYGRKLQAINGDRIFSDAIKPRALRENATWSRTGTGDNTVYSVRIPFDKEISTVGYVPNFTVKVGNDTVETKERKVTVVADNSGNRVLQVDFKAGKSGDNGKFVDAAEVRVDMRDQDNPNGYITVTDKSGNTTKVDFTVRAKYSVPTTPAAQTGSAQLNEAVTAADEAVTAADAAVKAADAADAAAKAAGADTAAADAAKKAADKAKADAVQAKADAVQAKADESVKAANRAKTAADKAKADADAAKAAADKAKKAVDKAAAPVAADAAVGAAETAITAAKTAITEADKGMTARGVKGKVTMARLKLEEAEAQVADAKTNLGKAKAESATAIKTVTYQEVVVAATKALEAATAAAATATEAATEAATAETDADVRDKVTDVKTTLATVKEKVEALKTAATAVRDANQ